MNVSQYCCAGLNFGYYYDKSPIIAYDGEPQPSYTMGSFTPSTGPGRRLPHVWLKDGRSLYDLLGPDYTLVRLDPELDVSGLEKAAKEARFPLAIADPHLADKASSYGHRLLLVRPDQHIAWRGNVIPKEAGSLIARLRGEPSLQTVELVK